MQDDASFLAAINADRENDLLRLVYADYLEERGDHRCEYLRAMCELLGLSGHWTARRRALLLSVEEYHAIGDHEWILLAARRFDVLMHTVDKPLLLRDLLAEVQRITGLNPFNAIDLVRGMPNTGRFRSDPRRVIQVSSLADAEEIVGRLRERGASASIAPATELVERVNLGLDVRVGPYRQPARR